MLYNHKQEENVIYWGHGGTYDSGTIVTIFGKDYVHFENALLPPGEAIHGWNSSGHYQSLRTIPSLPLLSRGHTYQLTLNMTPVPERSVFTRITFFNRYGDVDSHEVTKTTELTFVYPKNAYYYTINLISAGMTELTFHRLEIKEVTSLVQESGSTPTETSR